VPPLPASSSAMSTASLAANTKPLDGARELKIEEPRDKLVNRSSWEQPVVAADKTAGGAVLRNPEPIDSQFAKAELSAADSYQEIANVIQRRMTDYNAEKSGDGVRVVCTVPKKGDPAKSRSHEAYAATEIDAVKAILAKIDADQ
jgi:hypothetical protein